MTEQQSSLYPYLNWTKQRIDEMDATLASLEAKTKQMQADSKVKADQLIADLQKRRDEFEAMAKAQAHAGETAWQANKAQLDAQWQAFEAQVKTYFDSIGKQVEQQQATFRDAAAAQAKTWRDAADKFQAEAVKVAAEKRVEFNAAVRQMQTQAAEAEARLQKLKQAAGESWAVLSAGLAESRKAFDRASQQAWDAFKRSASPPAA